MLKVHTVILLISILAACKSSESPENLKSNVGARLAAVEGTFAVAFRDLHSGEEVLLNANETFHAASTMKTPVMIEVYKQVSEGRWSLSDSIEVKNEFRSIVDSSSFSLSIGDDSEEVLYTRLGEKATLAELVYDMITVSSNLATNIVIELVDARKVTQSMRVLGAKDIVVLRGVEDSKAYEQGLNNTTTAYDLMLILSQLARGECVSKEASDDMIRILKQQQFKEIIPALLPDDVKVAHKTGSITGVRHDSGIVFLPDGRRYVLVLLSKDMPDGDAGIQAMAEVSKMMYDYMLRKPHP